MREDSHRGVRRAIRSACAPGWCLPLTEAGAGTIAPVRERAYARRNRERPGPSQAAPKGARMADKPVFLYAAIYDDVADAEADYRSCRSPRRAASIGTFDPARDHKDEDGKVHVHKTEKPTQHGAWTGAGVGAVVGILFPPAIIGTRDRRRRRGRRGRSPLARHVAGRPQGARRGARRRRRGADRDRRVEDRRAGREGGQSRQEGASRSRSTPTPTSSSAS